MAVKANVLFFDNKSAAKEPWTKEIWYYDYRTNIHHTLKRKPMRFEDLSDFINCYFAMQGDMPQSPPGEGTRPTTRRLC